MRAYLRTNSIVLLLPIPTEPPSEQRRRGPATVWFSLPSHLLHMLHYHSCWEQNLGPAELRSRILSPVLNRSVKQTRAPKSKKCPHWEEEQIKRPNGLPTPRLSFGVLTGGLAVNRGQGECEPSNLGHRGHCGGPAHH